MLKKQPKDEFTEVKLMTVIETTHGSLNLHIPSTVAKALGLKKGQMLMCYQNKFRKSILYQSQPEKTNKENTVEE